LPEHEIKPGSEFFGKMPHRPVGPLANQAKRVCVTATGPIHGFLEQRRADALPSPSLIHEQHRFDSSRARSIVGADNTPQFVRNKQSGPPRSGPQNHLTRCLKERAVTTCLPGATQQSESLSFAASSKLPHNPVVTLGATNAVVARCNNSHVSNFVPNVFY
jgi:hypothetical protein